MHHVYLIRLKKAVKFRLFLLLNKLDRLRLLNLNSEDLNLIILNELFEVIRLTEYLVWSRGQRNICSDHNNEMTWYELTMARKGIRYMVESKKLKKIILKIKKR